MIDLRSQFYSPLCDVSLEAYCTYAEVCIKYASGDARVVVDKSSGYSSLVDAGVLGVSGGFSDSSRAIDVSDGAENGTVGVVDSVFAGCGVVASRLLRGGDSECVDGADGCSGVRCVVSDGAASSVEGSDKYVPPFKRGPKGGKSIGRGPNYLKNQAARERRAAAKCDRRSDDSGEGYVDKGKYSNRASFFDGLPREQVNELQRTRAEALLQKNLAEVTRQRTAAKRAAAEEQLLNLELESGAFENRIRTRNEATDRRAQDQSENVEFYRHTRGWAETVKSGEPSPVRGPSNVPSLSSGGSPRSESDWELEVKRRDEQNESLRKELDQARKELETYEQSAYDPMKGVVSVYEPCEYVMDGASRFDQAGFMEEYRQKDRARDFSVPLGTHIRPKEEVKLVGM